MVVCDGGAVISVFAVSVVWEGRHKVGERDQQPDKRKVPEITFTLRSPRSIVKRSRVSPEVVAVVSSKEINSIRSIIHKLSLDPDKSPS